MKIGVILDRKSAIHEPTPNRVKLSESSLSALCALADFAVVVATMLAIDLVYHGIWHGYAGSQVGRSAAILVSSLFVAFQVLQGAYRLQAYFDTPEHLRKLLFGWCGVFFIIGWVGFLLAILPGYSRIVLTISFASGLVLLIALRLATATMLRRKLAQGRLSLKKAYLICVGDRTQPKRIIRQATRSGTEVVSSLFIEPGIYNSGGGADRDSIGQTVLDSVRAAYQSEPFEEIYLSLPLHKWRPLNEVSLALTQIPLPVHLFPGEEMASVLRTPRVQVGRLMGFQVQRPPLSSIERHTKRGLDIAIALAALLAFVPLFAVVALAILAESGGPVIFRQSRKGFGERSFTIFKFRTMRVLENGDSIVQAKRKDARVTRVGAFLRRTSIDELPQLVNVLLGDMSIVGPRPHAIAHDNHYDTLISTYAFRHHVKPGLTGWAQVHGLRGETPVLGAMEDRVKFDIWYVNNWSIWLDLKIILRTAAALLRQQQAY